MQDVSLSRVPIRFSVFELDLRAGELRKDGVKVKLQEQPFQILQVLLEHPGEVVTREELQRRIWPADTFVDFDHGLYNAIKRLREALGDTAEAPRYIETLPKRGYRFIATLNGNGHARTAPVWARAGIACCAARSGSGAGRRARDGSSPLATDSLGRAGSDCSRGRATGGRAGRSCEQPSPLVFS
jgi:DNA-binding winged helix-turn-helix (wHTH) protein